MTAPDEASLLFGLASPEAPLTAVVVDDHGLFAAGLEFILNVASHGCITVVGRTTEASMALDLVRRHMPRLAIIDLAMPPPGGVEAIAQVKRHYPQVKVLALSGSDDPEFAMAALGAGANGFMLKSAKAEELVPPLLALALGVSIMPERLKDELVAHSVRPRDLLGRLTDQEVELWRLLGQGLDTLELGERLFVSERTIKRMVASLLGKVGAANRREAAALAGRAGLLDD
jgi:DNA-binding NarL/FixJ family response regulator